MGNDKECQPSELTPNPLNQKLQGGSPETCILTNILGDSNAETSSKAVLNDLFYFSLKLVTTVSTKALVMYADIGFYTRDQ